MQYIAELDGSKLENKHPTISVNVSQLGDHQILELPEFRELKNGGNAFKQIHNGTCVAPKIILLP